MSEVIEAFKSRKGRPPKHPWDLWANGKAHHLHRGTAEQVERGYKDFDAESSSMRTMIHRQARQMGLRAETDINKADQSIKVQFFPRHQR